MGSLMRKIILLALLISGLFANDLAEYIKNMDKMVLVKKSVIPGKDVVLPKNTPLFLQQTISMYNWINDGKGTRLNIYIPKDRVALYKKHGPYPDGLTAIATFEDQGIYFITEHIAGEPIYYTVNKNGQDISQTDPSLNTQQCYRCHEDYEDICINGTCATSAPNTKGKK